MTDFDRDWRKHRKQPQDIKDIKDKHGVPVTQPEWVKRFAQYATESRALLLFLRRSDETMMPEHLAVQLQNPAASFQEQADRFRKGKP